MRGATDILLTALALPVVLGLFVLGIILIVIAVASPNGVAEDWSLRLGGFFFGLCCIVPALTSSLFLRLRRVDRVYHDKVTNGWHTVAFVIFVGDREAIWRLFPHMKQIARNETYPQSLRSMAAVVRSLAVVAFAGLMLSLVVTALYHAFA